MQLTEHFTLEEFEYSPTAVACGIDNTVPKGLIPNIQHLCEQVLEPLRQWYGKPIRISSGYRCPELNAHHLVRGATYSKHLFGQAADLHLPDMKTAYRWIEFILENTDFDHLIMEHDSSGRHWIHVSCLLEGNRHVYTPNLLKK